MCHKKIEMVKFAVKLRLICNKRHKKWIKGWDVEGETYFTKYNQQRFISRIHKTLEQINKEKTTHIRWTSKLKSVSLKEKLYLCELCINIWMWELDCEESWAPKNWCFWTVVLEKTLQSPLDCKEIQPVHPEGDQSWVFIGRTGAEAETPVIWPPDAKSWIIGKDPDAGGDWGQEEKVTTEDEMAG